MEQNNQYYFNNTQRRVSPFQVALEVAFELVVFVAVVALIRAYWLY